MSYTATNKFFTFPTYSDTKDPDTTCNKLPVSDTSTETDSNADFIPFQDHTRYITGPSTRSQSESDTEEPYTSKHLTIGSIKLHEQSITILEDEQSHLDNTTEDEIISTPTDTNLSPFQDHITHLPRPPCSQSHAKPSCILVFQHKKYIKDSQPHASNKPTAPVQMHPHPQWTRKIPLLLTPPASERKFNNRNHYKQHTPGPSTFNNSRNPTFPRLSPFYNRFHQQPYTPRPFNHQQIPLLPLPSHIRMEHLKLVYYGPQ